MKGSAIAAGINRADYLDLVQKAAEPERSVTLHQHLQLELCISVDIKYIINILTALSVCFHDVRPGQKKKNVCGLPA